MSSEPSLAEELDFTQTVVNTFSLQFEEAELQTQDSKWPAQAVGPQSCNFWHAGFSALTAGYQVAMCKCTTLFKFSWFLDLQKKTWNYCSLIYISIYINTNATHG